MDWLRRNWPDLLIGLALIAVIAGIVATLLTGGSFFPLGGGSGPTVSAPATPSPPPAPSTPSDAPAPDEAPAAGAVEDGPSVAVLPPSDGDASDLPPGAPPPDAGADASPETPAVEPVAPDDAAAAPQPAAPAPEPEPAPEPAVEPAAPAPALDADLPTEPYRVSVGAFGSRENAQTQAARFREAGYPVFLGTQDDLTLVLVGPYEGAARAEAVAAEIRDGPYGIDPVIYEFRPDEGGDAASPEPQAASPETPPADPPEPSAAAPPEPAGAAEDGAVLQVGAYADQDSAAPQVERLTTLGFDVDTLREDGFVKLVIGPLAGAELDDARTILDGAGVEYFAR